MRSPTGSGKTLAYLIPIINEFRSAPPVLTPQAGSLANAPVARSCRPPVSRLGCSSLWCPTALTCQVFKICSAICKRCNLRTAIAVGSAGSATFDYRTGQKSRVDFEGDSIDGCDILVATPGRLMDLMFANSHGYSLALVTLGKQSTCLTCDTPAHALLSPLSRFLVLDEADRLLSQSYQSFLEYVVEPHKEATLSHGFDFLVADVCRSLSKDFLCQRRQGPQVPFFRHSD